MRTDRLAIAACLIVLLAIGAAVLVRPRLDAAEYQALRDDWLSTGVEPEAPPEARSGGLAAGRQ